MSKMEQSKNRIADEREAMVRYDNVTKIYDEGDSAITAVKDISLEVKEGEFVSIVGPSGCGKSTLLHMTCGLINPTQNDIIVDGLNVSSPDFERHRLGLVFQSPVLLEWRTVLKNVLLPAEIMLENGVIDGTMEEYEERSYELLKLVGLEGFEDVYPRELSGGMQQRVSICRSLIHDPNVLLMDEPFGALDAFTREKLNKELLQIWHETQKTILFVTHDLDEAIFLSDRVVVLSSRPGEIVDVIDVDLERPRTDKIRASELFHELVAEANSHFREETMIDELEPGEDSITN